MTKRREGNEPADRRAALGRAAEAYAERWLRDRGWTFLERRFRRSFGEIDLVFRHDETLVFVEVRSRTDWTRGRPAETIGRTKRRTLVRVALAWLRAHGALDRVCRFDVVEMRPEGDSWRLRHWPDAFRPEVSERGRRY